MHGKGKATGRAIYRERKKNIAKNSIYGYYVEYVNP